MEAPSHPCLPFEAGRQKKVRWGSIGSGVRPPGQAEGENAAGVLSGAPPLPWRRQDLLAERSSPQAGGQGSKQARGDEQASKLRRASTATARGGPVRRVWPGRDLPDSEMAWRAPAGRAFCLDGVDPKSAGPTGPGQAGQGRAGLTLACPRGRRKTQRSRPGPRAERLPRHLPAAARLRLARGLSGRCKQAVELSSAHQPTKTGMHEPRAQRRGRGLAWPGLSGLSSIVVAATNSPNVFAADKRHVHRETYGSMPASTLIEPARVCVHTAVSWTRWKKPRCAAPRRHTEHVVHTLSLIAWWSARCSPALGLACYVPERDRPGTGRKHRGPAFG
ncbi:uncharacterized protein PSFLO_05191 [Pseudozyma flocculosa]|uniref:Uncharacterized protein n=1 Tax=Pseudozyma flocculosa TaxID=84751 RepID=A0A5C3F6D6_9BASI|nr:uncharacterized protein PSFLO_05191 [Pseudozyma flocculosa]